MVTGQQPRREPRRRVFYDPSNRRNPFRDPDTGRFINYKDAIRRARFNFDAGRPIDSRGRFIAVERLRLPQRGSVITFPTVQARFLNFTGDPRTFRPGANQEIIEELVLVDRQGNIFTRQFSMGLGRRYDRSKVSKAWFRETASAAGVRKGEPGAYKSAQGAVLSRRFVIKTIRSR